MSKIVDYRPPLADYFNELERRHGAELDFSRLSLKELETIQRLALDAIERDPNVTQVEKKNLAPLLTLVDMHRRKRYADS